MKHGHSAVYRSYCLECNQEHVAEVLHDRDALRADLATTRQQLERAREAMVKADGLLSNPEMDSDGPDWYSAQLVLKAALAETEPKP